jgi:threonine/homoserine/homoserine lactone efflux protein
MVTMHQAVAFGLVALVVIAIPGPSVVFTVARALTYGRAVALTNVVGNSLGLLVALVLVVLGLGEVVATSDVVYDVVKFGGALYLVYLGVQALRHRRALTEAFNAEVRALPGKTLKVLRVGFVVGFANPKSIVFLAAILPQFVDPARGAIPVQIMILGIALPVIALLSDSSWALVASGARAWFARSPRRLELVGGTGGLVMIGLGTTLAVSGGKD